MLLASKSWKISNGQISRIIFHTMVVDDGIIKPCIGLSSRKFMFQHQYHYCAQFKYSILNLNTLFQAPLEDTSLIITEPYFNFTSVQENLTEVFFEEYQLSSIFRCNGGCHKNNCNSCIKFPVRNNSVQHVSDPKLNLSVNQQKITATTAQRPWFSAKIFLNEILF